MRTDILVSLLLCSLLLSCSKSGTQDTTPADPGHATDALWALAPADTLVGVVAAGGTGDTLLAAWAELARGLATRPGGQKAVDEIMVELRRELPAGVLDAGARARMGVDLSRGSAAFITGKGLIAVLPVSDRAAFRDAFDGREQGDTDLIGGGLCKELAGYYACAHTAEKLAGVGASSAMAETVAARPASLRGQVEVAVSGPALSEASRDKEMAWLGAFADLQGVDAALKLERGGFTARAHLHATPQTPQVAAFATVPDTLAQNAANKNPMGIWRVRVPWRQLVPMEELTRKLAPAAAMANLKSVQEDIIDNLTGELVLYSEPGDTRRFILEVGATRPERLQPMIRSLCTMARAAQSMVKVAIDGDRCTAVIDAATLRSAAPKLPIAGDVSLAVYTTDSALAASLTAGSKRIHRAVDPGPMGRELVSAPWSLAVWGYGNAATFGSPELFASFKDSPGYDAGMTAVWAIAHIIELGVAAAVRDDGVHAAIRLSTQWANPDAILRAFQDSVSKVLDGQPSAALELDQLAEKWPDSPFARAHAAGPDGLIVTSGMAGVLAAVAIPSFLKYVERSKAIEAGDL